MLASVVDLVTLVTAGEEGVALLLMLLFVDWKVFSLVEAAVVFVRGALELDS